MQFTIGLNLDGRTRHVTAAGDDALAAAQKVKCEHPDARITYVRPMNRRGDARHPTLHIEPSHVEDFVAPAPPGSAVQTIKEL
jgi:hypothetical protein